MPRAGHREMRAGRGGCPEGAARNHLSEGSDLAAPSTATAEHHPPQDTAGPPCCAWTAARPVDSRSRRAAPARSLEVLRSSSRYIVFNLGNAREAGQARPDAAAALQIAWRRRQASWM